MKGVALLFCLSVDRYRKAVVGIEAFLGGCEWIKLLSGAPTDGLQRLLLPVVTLEK